MGIKERIGKIFGRKKEEEGRGRKRYELRVMGEDGGWYKTGIVFEKPISQQEAAQFLGPGRYWLVEVEEGKPGFRKVWDKPLEVRYEMPEQNQQTVKEDRLKRRRNPLTDLIETAMAFSMDEETRKAFQESVKFLKRLFLGPDIEDAIDMIIKYRDKFKKIAPVFGLGEARGYTEEEGPEYEGKIPAWFHPKVIGTIRKEIRGVIKDIKNELLGGEEGTEDEIPEFPEEPKREMKKIEKRKE